MKIPQLKTLAVFSLLGALAYTANAQTLVTYLTSTGSTTAATFVDPSISAGAFAIPTGLTSNDTGFSTAGSPPTRNVYLRTDFIAANEAAALALSGRYFTFTLTPGSTPINFETMTFGLGVSSNVSGVPNESATAFVRTSLDSFASTIGTSVGLSNVAVPSSHANWPTTIVGQSISFGASLVNVSVPVTFRIYLTDTLTNTNTSLRLTNLEITGSAIPEPSTSALAASGMIGLFTVAFRRRRTARASE